MINKIEISKDDIDFSKIYGNPEDAKNSQNAIKGVHDEYFGDNGATLYFDEETGAIYEDNNGTEVLMGYANKNDIMSNSVVSNDVENTISNDADINNSVKETNASVSNNTTQSTTTDIKQIKINKDDIDFTKIYKNGSDAANSRNALKGVHDEYFGDNGGVLFFDEATGAIYEENNGVKTLMGYTTKDSLKNGNSISKMNYDKLMEAHKADLKERQTNHFYSNSNNSKPNNSSNNQTQQQSNNNSKTNNNSNSINSISIDDNKNTTTNNNNSQTNTQHNTDNSSQNNTKDPELVEKAQDVLNLINEERAKNGLSPLTWSGKLENAADIRAEEITQKFSHERPNDSEWWTVDDSVMYAENLAEGYDNPEDVLNAWMASPTHKENILDKDFKTCAISIYKRGGKLYWVQEFGY